MLQSTPQTDLSTDSSNKRASTEDENMPSPKRIADALYPYLDLFDSHLVCNFMSDGAIKKLCDKMSKNHELVKMGQEMLQSLDEDVLAENGTSRFDARKHFEALKNIWKNEQFSCFLYKTLEVQKCVLPDMIRHFSRKFLHENFEERIASIKKAYCFKYLLRPQDPFATNTTTMMRRLLIILIVCWSCEDEYPELDTMDCTVTVNAPLGEDTLHCLDLFQRLLWTMKQKGAPCDTIKELRSEVESSRVTDPLQIHLVIVSAMMKARTWLDEEGSPIPELVGECFIMELAIGIERKKNHELVAMAKSFLENIDSTDLANAHISPVSKQNCFDLVQRQSDLLKRVLDNSDFVDVFREKSKQDWYFRETIVEYENKYDMRRNKHTFSDDAIEDAMHRIKNDIFCRRILEKRKDIALLRGFLIIVFAYHTCDILKFVDGLRPGYPRRYKHIIHVPKFTGDVEGLKTAVDKEFNNGVDLPSQLVFRKLACIQFQHEVCGRLNCYSTHGYYTFVVTEDGRWLVRFEYE
ncbi:unnamed protein product [Cuscuta epithymum]|uniref:Uncharacterized protein n=1 Tax=Cuscuta epithymum TaxID=186058 RepID=A0AAV0F627_9ASTE|nr:unnamed protein product [Cuscuta epithymum]CAH9130812.1 unnamed protein product [Cuscuta epithymum]